MTKASETNDASDGHTYSFVAEEALKGNIDEVSAALGERSFAELGELHDFEHSDKGAKRTGMLAAIDRERDARGEAHTAALEAARTAAERAGRRIFTEEDFDDASKQALADAETAKAGQAELQKQVEALTAERDEARTALAAAQKGGSAPTPPKKAKAPKPRVFEVAEGEADLSQSTTVAFGDARGVSFPAIADLEFGEGDFASRHGGTRLLQQPIDFDGTEEATEISAAYLLDKSGKAVAVSPFFQPLQVGGGRKATLRPGTLLFRGGEAKPTPEQAAQAAQA